MIGGRRAVVPPAGVPQTLKEPLWVVLGVTSNEVQIAAEGFLQQPQSPSTGPILGHDLDGRGEVSGQLEGHAGRDLGLQEGQVGQDGFQPLPVLGGDEVIAQVLEVVPVIGAAVPAPGTLRAIGFNHLGVKLGRILIVPLGATGSEIVNQVV